MARPYKARRICSVPTIDTFGPLNQEMDSAVELTLEEYETIRLIDWLDCTQEECADQMGVARTTVQAVYNSARKKLADCRGQWEKDWKSGEATTSCARTEETAAGRTAGNSDAADAASNNKPGGDCNEDCCNI